MDVRVTNTCIENIESNIVGTQLATIKLIWHERLLSLHDCITTCIHHSLLLGYLLVKIYDSLKGSGSWEIWPAREALAVT